MINRLITNLQNKNTDATSNTEVAKTNLNAVDRGQTSAPPAGGYAESHPLAANSNPNPAIIQNINPTKEIQTKEIQTIHTNTVTEHTNTVVVDEDTKNKVNLLLRQLDSDRPNYSVGQAYTLPANLLGTTLNIGAGSFTIGANGDANVQNLTAEHDLTVRGNFSVTGSQAYTGAASFTSASASSTLTSTNTGSGYAMQADNVTAKTNTLNTTTGNLILNSNNGLVEIAGSGIKLANSVPSDTSMALYNDSGTLKWNGAALATGSGISGTANYLPKFTSGTSLGNSVLYESGGNVGIGTTAPANRLVVGDGSTGASGVPNNTVSIGNSSGDSALFFGQSSTSLSYLRWVYNVSTPSAYFKIGTYGGNNPIVFFPTESAGNVSIGTNTNPNSRLVIKGLTADNTRSSLNVTNSTNSSLLYVRNDGNAGIGRTSPSFKLDVSGTLNASATSTFGGNVGIGTAAPAYPLDVNGAIHSAGMTISGDIYSGSIYLSSKVGSLSYGPRFTGQDIIFRNFAGDEKMRILDTGNVGIGTTAPLYKLDVVGSGTANLFEVGVSGVTNGFTISSSSNAMTYDFRGSDNASKLRITDSGSVGIGTTAPGAKLDIQGTSGTTLLSIGASGDNGDMVVLNGDNAVFTSAANKPLLLRSGINANLYLQSGGSNTRLAIDNSGNFNFNAGQMYVQQSSGNVGIGTTGPTLGKLQIVQSADSVDNGITLTNVAGGTLRLWKDASGAARIDSAAAANGIISLNGIGGGNVGIGTTTPTAKLDIRGINATTPTFLSVGNSDNSYLLSLYGGMSGDDPAVIWKTARNLRFGFANDNGGSGFTEKMRIDNAGNVGIGTTAPVQKLDVAGKLAQNGTVIAYLPDQTTFAGSFVLGDGGNNLSNIGGNTGKANTFIGLGSGAANTTGYWNTAVGYKAFYSNSTGYFNTAHGYQSLYTNSSGNFNSAYGMNTLYSNSTGTYNTAIGYQPLYNNTTGSYNTALGVALLNSTTGSYNTAIGDTAGNFTVSGSYNTIVGRGAGYGVYGNSFSNNSLFGYYSGYALTTGSNNILLGYRSGDNLTTGSNNILIGYDIEAPAVAGSSQLSIGNLIFAAGGFGTGTSVGAGSIGIGTASPGTRLDVVGAGITSATAAMNIMNASSTSALYVRNDGNVGIGTTAPTYKLDISGTMRATATSTFDAGVLMAGLPAGAGAGFLCRDANGVVSYSSGAACTGSSEVIKHNIASANYGLDQIIQLEPKTFVYNWDSDDKVKLGFIAEEVAKVNPLFASFDGQGNPIGLSDRGIMAAMVQAIKDQQKEIDGLKLILGPAGTISNTSSTVAAGPQGGLSDWLLNSLNSLGIAVKDGVASLKEVVAGKATIDQIQGKQMCLKNSAGNDICVTGDQLEQFLRTSGAAVTTVKEYPKTEPVVNNATTTSESASATSEIAPGLPAEMIAPESASSTENIAP